MVIRNKKPLQFYGYERMTISMNKINEDKLKAYVEEIGGTYRKINDYEFLLWLNGEKEGQDSPIKLMTHAQFLTFCIGFEGGIRYFMSRYEIREEKVMRNK